MVDTLGMRAWFLIGGLAMAVMGLGALYVPAIRRLDDGERSWERIPSQYIFTSERGWDEEKYDATIHFADIDGDGVDELLGRGPDGMVAYRYKNAGPMPTLGEVRGKIVILDDFSGSTDDCLNGEPSFTRFGLKYGEPCQLIQDEYQLENHLSLRDMKWPAVEKHLSDADKGADDDIYINYLSGVDNDWADPQAVLPFFVAGGHWCVPGNYDYYSQGDHQSMSHECEQGHNCEVFFYPWPYGECNDGRCQLYFTGTNELTALYLSKHTPREQARRWGIIMADFPGWYLIHSIIGANFPAQSISYLPVISNEP